MKFAIKSSITGLNFLLLSLVFLGVSCGEKPDGGVLRSLDSGETWEQKVFVNQNGRRTTTIADLPVSLMVFHPTDANIIYMGTKGNGLYITLTGGEQWIPSSITTGNIASIAIDPIDPRIIYLAKGTSILKSTDEGLTWETVYQDVNSATINVVLVDSYEHSRVYAATSAGTILKSYDYGINWDLRMQMDQSIKRLLMANFDTRILYALTSEQKIYVTTTGGEAPETVTEDGAEVDAAVEVNAGWELLLDKTFKEQYNDGEKVSDIVLDPNDNTILYLVSRRGLMRGANNGTGWTDIATLVGVEDKQNDTIKNLTITPGDSKTMYFTIGHIIHKSTDGGQTWKIIENFPSSRSITELIVDYQTPNVLYAGTQTIEKKGGLFIRK